MEEEKNEERLMINSQIRTVIICPLFRNDEFYGTSEKLYAQKTDLVPEKDKLESIKLKS